MISKMPAEREFLSSPNRGSSVFQCDLTAMKGPRGGFYVNSPCLPEVDLKDSSANLRFDVLNSEL